MRARLTRLIKQLREETLDESAPSGASTDLASMARDLGYRAGHNDRNRVIVRHLEREVAVCLDVEALLRARLSPQMPRDYNAGIQLALDILADNGDARCETCRRDGSLACQHGRSDS